MAGNNNKDYWQDRALEAEHDVHIGIVVVVIMGILTVIGLYLILWGGL